MDTQQIVAASREWINQNGHHILQEYCDLLRLPNHASDLPNIERNCEFISQMFAKRGFEMQLGDPSGSSRPASRPHRRSHASATTQPERTAAR